MGQKHRSPSPQLVHVGSRTVAVRFASDDQFSVHIADDASWVDHLDYPVGPINAPPANLRVIRTASNFSEWAAAFVFTGSFVVFDGDSVRCTGDLREADALRATPQEIGSETNVAAAAVVADNALWVRGIALDDRALRFADEYDLAACAYRRSRSASTSTGTASADPQFPNPTATFRFSPAYPDRRIADPRVHSSHSSYVIRMSEIKDGYVVPGSSPAVPTRSRSRKRSRSRSRASKSASPLICSSFGPFHGQTSWELCRLTGYEIRLNTGFIRRRT